MAKTDSFSFPSVEPQAKIQPRSTIDTSKKEASQSPKLKPAEAAAPVPLDHAKDIDTQNSKNQLSLKPRNKEKQKVNYNIDKSIKEEFTEINKGLGYSDNEVIVHLMKEYIKANK